MKLCGGFVASRAWRRALSLAEFKALVREQFYLLLIDQEAALAAIPKMLPEDVGSTPAGCSMSVKRVLTACGPLDGEDQARLARITQTVRSGRYAVGVENVVPFSPTRPEVQSKAS